MKRIIAGLLLACGILYAVNAVYAQLPEKKLIAAPGAKIGLFSPGVKVGKTIFVSGKGDHIPGGGHPDTFAGSVRQCLENVRSTLELDGLDMRNVVKAWVFLKDLNDYDELNKAFFEIWPQNFPARTTLQVGNIPGDSRIEITVIAYSDLSGIRHINPEHLAAQGRPYSAGVIGGDLLYLSGKGDTRHDGSRPDTFDEQVKQTMENVGGVLKEAGIDFSHIVWCNPYLDAYENYGTMNSVYKQYFEFGATPGRGTIFVDKIPGGSHVEITCIATINKSTRKVIRPANMEPSATASPAVWGGDFLFLSSKSGFVPGNGIVAQDFEGQLHQVFQNLLDGLQEAGLGFGDCVSANVYLRDLGFYDRLNKIFRQYFPEGPPVRTTFQQNSGYEKNNALVQISLIAAKAQMK